MAPPVVLAQAAAQAAPKERQYFIEKGQLQSAQQATSFGGPPPQDWGQMAAFDVNHTGVNYLPPTSGSVTISGNHYLNQGMVRG